MVLGPGLLQPQGERGAGLEFSAPPPPGGREAQVWLNPRFISFSMVVGTGTAAVNASSG